MQLSGLTGGVLKAGDLVAIVGIGGLGHLGVQFARHMGFETVAIGRGTKNAETAKKLGAHHYVNSTTTDIAEALKKLGGASLVVITASAGRVAAETIKA